MTTKTMPEKSYKQSRLTLKKDNLDQLARLKRYIKNPLKNCWALTIHWQNSKTKNTLSMTNMNNKRNKFWDKSETSTKKFSTRSTPQHPSWPISMHCHKVTALRLWNGVNSTLTNKLKSTISYWRTNLIRNLISNNSHPDSTISYHQRSWTRFWTRVKKEPTEPVWREASAQPADMVLINDPIYLFFF